MQFTICYLFIYFFEALIVFLYTSTIFQKRKRIIINISYILILYFVLFTISHFNNVTINIVAFLVANLAYIFTVYKQSIRTSFFHSICITIFMLLSEIISSSLFSQIAFNFFIKEKTIQSIIIFSVASKLLFFVCLYITSRFYSKQTDFSSNNGTALLGITAIISLVILLTFAAICENNKLSKTLNQLVILCSFLLFVLSFAIVLFYIDLQNRTRNYLELKMQFQREHDYSIYQKELIREDENQKILIHDIRKHLFAISALNDDGEPEKLSLYLKQLIESSTLQSSVKLSNNTLLNSILCRYQKKVNEYDIKFHIDIRSNCIDFLSDNELTSLFCNLLDNAIESATTIKDSFIELYVSKMDKKNIIVISMINSCGYNPYGCHSNKQLKSTKGRIHGYGLKSIKSIALKYNGNLETYFDEASKTFHTIVTLIR